MEVQLTPEQEAENQQNWPHAKPQCESVGTGSDRLLPGHEARFIEAVKRGLESLDRGEYSP